MPVCWKPRKPCSIASRRYGPGGRFGMAYEPSTSVVTSRFRPVSVCVAVTATPGSTPPLASLTTPLICAVAPACANAFALARRRKKTLKTKPHTRFIQASPVNKVETVKCQYGGEYNRRQHEINVLKAQ